MLEPEKKIMNKTRAATQVNPWSVLPLAEDKNTVFFKKGHSRPLFIHFRLFSTVDNKQVN